MRRSARDRSRVETIELRTVSYVSGPLLFIDHAHGVHAEEVVDVVTPDGEIRSGQVLEVDGARAVIEVYSGTRGLDLATTGVRLGGDSSRLGVGLDLLGRMFDGSGAPIDGGPPPMPEEFWDVNGLPINPAARRYPSEFIETGISTIDGLNTLVRGQKLPIFSGFGLPAGELAADISTHATVAGAEDDEFVVVFAAMGTTAREASFFRRHLEESGRLNRTVLFLNLADDPTIERLLTPRLALTAAEFLAFERGLHVLVILTDMTNYCEALREVATAREEVPRPARLPRVHVHGPGFDLRAGRSPPWPCRVGHPVDHPVDARRRHHTPDPGSGRVHHRGSDRVVA